MQVKNKSFQRETVMIGLIVVVAALFGVMYIFLMPPWQHYDEPKHFEYVWLTAHLNYIPTGDSYSPKLSRQVSKSMIRNGFYDHFGVAPLIGPPSEKVVIPGYSQFNEPPLYYIIASLPVRFFSTRNIETQLYSARLVSLIFLLVTVISAWGMASELASPGHPLRWMLPLMVALTPAFVDLMTAVNNDTLSIAVASLYLWVGVRLIRRGFSWLDFFLLSLLGGVTYFVKQTSMVVLAVYPLILLFSLVRGNLRKFAWAALVIGLVSVIGFSLNWDDALGWYRNTSQLEPTRLQLKQTPLGNHALVLKAGAKVTPPSYPELFQNLPVRIGYEMAGKPVTFGYWIWSDQVQSIRAPILKTANQNFSEKLRATLEPKFYSFHATLPLDTDRIWIYLMPEPEKKGSNIYYDGLVLVEGERPISEIPQFTSADGKNGVWGGESFDNLLHNGSAELAGPRITPVLDDFAARFLPDHARPSLLIGSLIDSEGSSDLYPSSAWNLFRTFWARFGWGNVPVFGGEITYKILLVFTLLGIFGAILGAIRVPSRVPWDLVATLGLLSIFDLFLAFTRGGAYLPLMGFYYPTARHFYPVVLPLLLLFSAGWLNLFQTIHIFWQRVIRKENLPWDDSIKLEAPLGLQISVFLVILLVLDVLSVIGISTYYNLS
jgi:hypothetical protein